MMARSGSEHTAVSATLHCLTGCAIGEILGLAIGTALKLPTVTTIALAVILAFFFGYALSLLPLLKGGLSIKSALGIAFAADTLSITTMEIVDNIVVLIIPGALNAGLADPLFWFSIAIALTVAFFAALPVNSYLIKRGKGHALAHAHHAHEHKD
jgi:hypothetical protein